MGEDDDTTQIHFTPYNQWVIPKLDIEKSVFDVENYKLPKTNRNMKLICYSHEQGFNTWDDYRDHLLDTFLGWFI